MMDWLLGGSKTAEKLINGGMAAVKGIGEYIDEQELTDEEKTKHRAEMLRQHSMFVQNTLQENGKRSTTRRAIAWAVVGTVILSYLICLLSLFLNLPMVEESVISLIKAFWLGEAFVAVIAFYFGAHLLKR